MSKYPYLFAELLSDPNWTEEDLKKLAGLNFLRVFNQVEMDNLITYYEGEIEKIQEELDVHNATAHI